MHTLTLELRWKRNSEEWWRNFTELINRGVSDVTQECWSQSQLNIRTIERCKSEWYTFLTCLVKSCTMLCSDTWEPIANRLFNCFSMREIISWSSWVVKPSTPDKRHDIIHNSMHKQQNLQQTCIDPYTQILEMIVYQYYYLFSTTKNTASHTAIPDRLPDSAASRVDTWKSRRASSTSSSPAIAWSFILARDSAIRTTASNCL